MLKARLTSPTVGLLMLLVGLLSSGSLMAGANSSSVEKRLSDWQIIGTGYKPGTQEVIFYEYHRFILDEAGYIQKRYVEYRLPDQSLKSVKEIDYSTGPAWRPSFTYDDKEVGYQVGVTVENGEGLLYRASEATGYESARLSIQTNTVIDAGFDAYIQHVWPRLEKQESVPFEFFAPLKLSRYSFAIQLTSQRQGVCQIEMSLKWWLVDWFLAPVSLEYDCSTRRLLRYQGITNLRDTNHDQYSADIHYQWQGDYPPFHLGG